MLLLREPILGYMRGYAADRRYTLPWELLVCSSNSARGSDAWNSHGIYIHFALIMRSTANTVLEHTLGQGVVRKRKRVVRKTEVVRRKKVARTVAARRARATVTTGRA